MRLTPRGWGPRTLGAQLVIVTAASVLISNLAVAAWFELGREQQSVSALNERLLDRAVSAATLLSTIPAKQREAAAHAMSSVLWKFGLRHGKDVAEPMSVAEQALATRARAMLPAVRANQPVSVHFSNGKHGAGDAAVEIVLPVVRNTQLITRYLHPPFPPWPGQILLAAVATVITTSIAAAFLARRVSQPLSDLSRAASIAAQGGSTPHVAEQGPEDVRQAATAFNLMTDRVTRTLESQRQLLSAVGHDLRTPITAMRINIEFVADSELRDRLERNLGELQELTEAVLSAAKGTGGEQARRVDLAALVESLCADLDDLDEAVEWQPHGPAPITCRPNEIRRAVRNLIENAITYGRRASVSLSATPHAYEVIVDDDGPGISEADRARVFEPFIRLEGSRNSETGGTGLGLTLVRTIAEGHGGAILLENRSEGGLRARLCLPRKSNTA